MYVYLIKSCEEELYYLLNGEASVEFYPLKYSNDVVLRDEVWRSLIMCHILVIFVVYQSS